MLYVTTHLRAGSSWGLAARLFLRALADTSMPFRLLWTSAAVVSSARKGGVYQSLGDVFDLSALPLSMQPLRAHFGPGSPPVRPTAMLFVGEVADAIERISHRDDCPPKNAVLTSWPASTIPPHLALRLGAYDVVFVPAGEGQVFADSDVPRVVEVPWALKHSLAHAAGTLPTPPSHVRRMLLVAGDWNGEDNVQRVAETFVNGLTREDGVGLIIACPNFPSTWAKEIARGKDKKTLPFVHVADPFGLSDDPTAADPLFSFAHAFVDTSRRVSPSFWRKRAEMLGCPVITVTTAGTVPYAGGELWPGAHSGQGWRELLPEENVLAALRAQTSARRVSLPATQRDASAVLTEGITRMLEGAPLAEVVQPAKPVQHVVQSTKDGIGVVVPFSGEGSDALQALQRCLDALVAARRPQDRIVISVRMPFTTSAVAAVGIRAGATVIHSTSGGDRWNMSAVRNAGVRYLEHATDVAYAAFVDADVAVPFVYLHQLAREAYKRPGMILTPYVVDEGRDAAETRRIASGMSMYPLKLIHDARGFDEGFVGWGHEDIELQHRLRERGGVPSVALASMAPALHTPHEARGGGTQRQADHEANLKRYEAAARRLDAGDESYVVNEDDAWGEYVLVWEADA